jgi:hypothetical protein
VGFVDVDIDVRLSTGTGVQGGGRIAVLELIQAYITCANSPRQHRGEYARDNPTGSESLGRRLALINRD